MGNLFTVWLAKGIYYFSRTFNIGAGGTWPGHVLLKFNPHILKHLSRTLKSGSILITGTNGKTTTTKITETILKANLVSSITNSSGANLLNGIASTFVINSSLTGRIKADVGLFEVDEFVFPHALKVLSPKVVVILNLFRDQLDRYWEIDTVAKNWRKALLSLKSSTTVILNADDPTVASLATDLKIPCVFFGLDSPKFYQTTVQHARDAIFCPLCGARLNFRGFYYSHLGDWECQKCGNRRPELDIASCDFRQPLPGVYNYYNAAAALLVARALGLPLKVSLKALDKVSPAFGRLEDFKYNNRSICILLSKNPTGFNESLRTLEELSKGKLVALLVLNDNIPDGRDISWIWDVDFYCLKKKAKRIIVSGKRSADLGLRLKYSGINKKLLTVVPDISGALSLGISSIPVGDTLYILPTYSAMLEVRKILTGRSIL